MQTSGIVRSVDKLGRVVIPVEYRKQYDMMIGDAVEVVGTDDGVLVKPYNPNCIFCKGTNDVQEHLGQLICADCRAHFKRLGSGDGKIKI